MTAMPMSEAALWCGSELVTHGPNRVIYSTSSIIIIRDDNVCVYNYVCVAGATTGSQHDTTQALWGLAASILPMNLILLSQKGYLLCRIANQHLVSCCGGGGSMWLKAREGREEGGGGGEGGGTEGGRRNAASILPRNPILLSQKGNLLCCSVNQPLVSV